MDRQTEKPADEPSPAPIGSSDLTSISTDERSLKIHKLKKCQVVKHKIFNYSTVEFRWLELERTVKMCSSYGNSSHRSAVISDRIKYLKCGSDKGPFHNAMINNWCPEQWSLEVKKKQI